MKKGVVRYTKTAVGSRKLRRELWSELRKYGERPDKPTLCRNATLFNAVWDPESIDFGDQDALHAEAGPEGHDTPAIPLWAR